MDSLTIGQPAPNTGIRRVPGPCGPGAPGAPGASTPAASPTFMGDQWSPSRASVEEAFRSGRDFANPGCLGAYPPAQRPGYRQSDARAERTYATEAEARAAFQRAASALGEVNGWEALSPAIPTRTGFKVHDANGQVVFNRAPRAGDYVQIDLPGPVGADWVRIEDVTKTPDKLQLTVRPSHDPTQRPARPGQVAHFYTSEATNTFTVERQGTTVVARVEGRNERPNLAGQAGSSIQAQRHLAVVGGTELGMQQMQWEGFTANLLAAGR